MGYKTVPMDMHLYTIEHMVLTGEYTKTMHTQPVSAYTTKKERKS